MQDRFKEAFVRTKTLKAEVLLVKAMDAKGKTLEAQQESIKKSLADHGTVTKTVKEDWIFAPLLAAANTLLAKKAEEKKNEKEKVEKKKK